jgi:hypothetical protein
MDKTTTTPKRRRSSNKNHSRKRMILDYKKSVKNSCIRKKYKLKVWRGFAGKDCSGCISYTCYEIDSANSPEGFTSSTV